MTSRLREGLLWVGAVAGVVSMLAAVAVTFFGFSFLIFRSGSMGPEIPTGSLALARTTPATELRSGDVVSVLASSGERITHRVISSTLRGDGAALILQGDANAAADEEIYLVTEAEREIASVPVVGYAVSVLLSPAGLVAAGCFAVMLLLVGFGPGKGDTPAPPTREGGRHRGETARSSQRASTQAGVGVSLVVAVALGAGVATTSAAFTDQATRATGQFTAASFPAPMLTCRDEGDSLTISFPVTGPTSVVYSATINSNASLSVTGSGATRSIGINQSQAPVNGFFGFGSTNYTVTVTSKIGSWSKSSTVDINSSRRLFSNPDMSCL